MGFDKARYESRLDGLGLNAVEIALVLVIMEAAYWEGRRHGLDEMSDRMAAILRARTGEKRDEHEQA